MSRTGSIQPAIHAIGSLAERWGLHWERLRERLLLPLRLGTALVAQERLIFPGRRSQGNSMSRLRASLGCELLEFTAAGGHKLAALYGSALGENHRRLPNPAARPTVLFFYGNDMCLATARPIFQRLRRLECNVLMPEYQGYGLSEGDPCEHGCYATADAAWKHLHSRNDIDPARIIIAGCSLGGAVAIDLASRTRPRALAVLLTFSSVVDLARHHLPWLPRAILRHRFDSASKMGRIACPTLIASSCNDNLVPQHMADRLAAGCRAPVTRITIDSAGHDSDSVLAAERQLMPALRRFIASI